ncbi:hypothetical protein J5837_15065 [Pseudoxanthomonas helianthi]|uniref:Uncharacterized protein n=1 Tax=Pseudoxanthomonas helianthi TaxID=1453541 RepID=A0A940X960_9GAMM|nr:hypothetical protein [Pseudoxanthomonas helianthi]MBP3985729.1 hypothetical protein [Pseudoxanthomonas helianthi]
MTDPVKENRIWDYLVRAVALLTFVSLIYGGIQWMTKPSAKLQATIDRGAFYTPPSYTDYFDAVDRTLASENIEKFLLPSDKPEPDTNKKQRATNTRYASFDLSSSLKNELWEKRKATLSSYSGYWEAEIKNTGSLPVKGVILRLPYTLVATIKREGGESTVDSKGPAVELGDLQAGETARVIAWMGNYYSFMSDKPSLYYVDGPGAITLKYEPSILEWLEVNIFNVGFAILLATLITKIYFDVKQIRREAKLAKAKAEHETKRQGEM